MKCDKTNINMIVIVTCGMGPTIKYQHVLCFTYMVVFTCSPSLCSCWLKSFPSSSCTAYPYLEGYELNNEDLFGITLDFHLMFAWSTNQSTCMAWELLLPHCWMLHLHLHHLHHHHHRCHMSPARVVWFWIFPGHDTFTLLEIHWDWWHSADKYWQRDTNKLITTKGNQSI